MEISFKPGWVRSAQTWQLDSGKLITPKQKQIDLSAVNKAHFVDMPYKRMWTTELKLTTPDEAVSIICNDKQRGENRQLCFALIDAVLDSLTTHNPTLSIRRGHGRIANYCFAAIGLIPLGFGLSFIIDAIKDDFSTFGLGFGAFFILMAAFLVWSASPWKPSPMNTPKELREWLSQGVASTSR